MPTEIGGKKKTENIVVKDSDKGRISMERHNVIVVDNKTPRQEWGYIIPIHGNLPRRQRERGTQRIEE